MGCLQSSRVASYSGSPSERKPLVEKAPDQQIPSDWTRDVKGAPNPRQQKWYHGRIKNALAERRLNSVVEGRPRSNGTYLVYDNPSYPSEESRDMYVVLVYKDKGMHRCMIRRQSDEKFVAGSNPRAHSTVKKLIKYHRGVFGRSMPLERGGQVVLRDYARM